MLSREQILAAKEPPAGTIAIPEWGGDVGIRRLSALEIRELRKDNPGEDTIESLARFAAQVLCDDRGDRLFSDAQAPELESRGWTVLLAIAKKANHLNGGTAEAREEIRKNSESGSTSETT
jgi:hypothetical protein